MAAPKKGLALIIASKIPPPGKLKASKGADKPEPAAEEEAEGGGEDMGKMSAAEDLAAAVKAGDAKGIVAAFEDLYALCAGGGDVAEAE